MIDAANDAKSKKSANRAASGSSPASPGISSNALAVPEDLLRPLAMRSMLMRPTYLEKSAWLEHIPFAFWLTEAHQPDVFVELGTHYGSSYFAFCQAVDRLGLNTKCFAVDTWQGDEHAGHYGAEVLEQVTKHNEAQYSSFSCLVRSTFDEALDHFSDGTVDLLHIDGLHTLEAVRHDFESWLPKLSDRAVVILHDCNVRVRNFGVFKLVEELRETYPVFEFPFGHGLAVIGVGSEQNSLLRGLFKSSDEEHARRAIHDIFGRLGRGCADTQAATERLENYRVLEAAYKTQKQKGEDLRQLVEKVRGDLSSQTKEAADLRKKLEKQVEQHAAQTGQFSERINLLQELRSEMKADIARITERADQSAAELRTRTEEMLKHQSGAAAVERQLNDALATAQRTEAELSEQLVQERERLKTKEAARASAEQALAEGVVIERSVLETLQKELDEAKSLAQEKGEELSALRKENESHKTDAANLTRIRAELAKSERALSEAQREETESRNALSQIESSVDERFEEIAKMTKLLQRSQAGSEKERDNREWLTRVHAHLAEMPFWTALMPNSWRQKRRLRLLKRAGLFDGARYLELYPDVVDEGMDPLRHYILHGIGEERHRPT